MPANRIIRLGSKAWVLTTPETGAFGHTILDLLVSLHSARAVGGRAYWFRTREANQALFELRAEGASTSVVSGVRGCWPWTLRLIVDCRDNLTMVGAAVRRTARARLRDAARSSQAAGNRRESALRRTLARERRKRRRRSQPMIGVDFRKSIALSPIPVSLPPHVDAEAAHAARGLGLVPGQPLIALHVRESGYKEQAGGDEPTDMMRNASISTYVAAIDFLVGEGFMVVRIGDSSMSPLRRHGVVDLATASSRSELVELWAVLRSEFVIACDSGPSMLGWLASVPTLSVNVTNPLANYPLRTDDLYVLKHVLDRRTGASLEAAELFGDEYLQTRKDLTRWRYVDNTSEDILAAVNDMLAVLRGPPAPTAAQRTFKRLAEQALEQESIAERMDKRSGPFYLGAGWAAPSFARLCVSGGRKHFTTDPR